MKVWHLYPSAPARWQEKGASTFCTLNKHTPSWTRILYPFQLFYRPLYLNFGPLSSNGKYLHHYIGREHKVVERRRNTTQHSLLRLQFVTTSNTRSHTLHRQTTPTPLVTGVERLYLVPEVSSNHSLPLQLEPNWPFTLKRYWTISTQRTYFPHNCAIQHSRRTSDRSIRRTYPITYLVYLRNTTIFARKYTSITVPFAPISALSFFGRLSNFAY